MYDITEWYPAKKNFRYERGSRKILKFIILVLFNIFAGWKTDSFIFGEHYKSVAFRLLFFWKPSVFLPYYPDLNYIKKYPLHKIDKELNLFYSGMINSDKGIDALINAVEIVGRNRPELNINLKIIGNFPSKADEMNFESRCASFTPNVRTTIREKLAFPEYCTVMGDTDIFFDLRTKDIENTFCVPIKLFYYLACGRPVIYSNLRSIRNIIDHFDFGHLCEPNDAQTIAAHIINYTLNPEIYLLHATNALRVSEEKFNWNCIETDFILFIDKQFN